ETVRRVRIAPQGGDGGDTHHDDQGEHHRVFDCGGAVFVLQKVHEALGHSAHVRSPVDERSEASLPTAIDHRDPRPAGRLAPRHEPEGPDAFCNAGLAYVDCVVLPMLLTEIITATIKASITAYSAAVG